MTVDLWQIIAALIALTTLATGTAIWVYKSSITQVRSTAESVVQSVKETLADVKSDIRTHQEKVDKKIDDMYGILDNRDNKMAERVDAQLSEIKSSVTGVDRHISSLKDTVHEQDKSLLQFRIELNDKFASKEEVKRLETEVERLRIFNSN